VLNPEQICSSFCIEIADVYSLAAATTARKEAEARAARKAYEKRKTRAAQASVLLENLVQAETNAAAAAPHPMAPIRSLPLQINISRVPILKAAAVESDLPNLISFLFYL
jgi:uncharacterized protein YggE